MKTTLLGAVLLVAAEIPTTSAATLSFGPISSTSGDSMTFSLFIDYNPPSSGNGDVTMTQFNSYCWGISSAGAGDAGLCGTGPKGFNDYSTISFKNYLPISWAFSAEQFQAFTTANFILFGGVGGSSILGEVNGYFGYADFSSCPWNQGCAADVSPVPVPAALPLLASGLGALGFIGWRRNRKAVAAA